jgi:PAS domain S-box-containing protein
MKNDQQDYQRQSQGANEEFLHAHDDIRARLEQYTELYDFAPVGYVTLDSMGVIREANLTTARLLGIKRVQLVNRCLGDFISKEDQPRFSAFLGQVFSGKNKLSCEVQFIREETPSLWGQIEAAISGDGQECRTIVTDITARKQAEAALRDAERFAQTTIDTLSAHLCVLDELGQIISVNKAWHEFAKANPPTPRNCARGANYLTVCDEAAYPDAETARAFAAGIRSVIKGEQREFSMEYPCHSLTQQRWFIGRVTRFSGDRPTRVVIAHENITERKKVEERLCQVHDQLRALAARLQAAREEERTRISREIHDELGQMLTGLKMDLRWAESCLEEIKDPRINPILDKLVAASELASATIAAIQRIATGLRPSILDRLGLIMALRYEISQYEDRHGIKCHLNAPEEVTSVSPELATAFFRIFQEILTNVVRHAVASSVEAAFWCEPGWFILEVSDDGKGMENSELGAPNSLGLLGMRERAQLLGGTIVFQPGNEKGTKVVVRLPQITYRTV